MDVRCLLRLLGLVSLWLTVACETGPEPDLAGPHVVTPPLVGTRSVGVETWPALDVWFSEDVDPASAGAVALLPWETVGKCELDPVCAEGSCEAGRCQQDPVTTGVWRALADRETHADALAEAVAVEVSVDGHHLRVVPRRALAPHHRYSLVLGEGVRDRGGAPLVDDDGLQSTARWDFVTAGEGSSGPEPRLAWPPPQTVDVPPNVSRLEIEFRRPVKLRDDDHVSLIDEHGARARLVDLRLCDGWVPGFCVAGRPSSPLFGDTWYRVEGTTLRDLHDRSGVPPHEVEWFRTATKPYTADPVLDGVEAVLHGPCAHLSGFGNTIVELRLSAEGEARWLRTDGGAVGIRVPDDAGVHALRLEAVDWVDQRVEAQRSVVRSAPRPRLEITEILGNAAGSEPANEFVELRVPPGGDPLDLSGLFIADLPWAEVQDAIAAGEPAPGDALPDAIVAPGQVAVVVGEGFVGDTLPPWPDDALELVVDGTIAAGGLKNAGEPITIYRAFPPTLVTSYGDWLDTSSSAFDGVSIEAAPQQVCDLPARWRIIGGGKPSPGRYP